MKKIICIALTLSVLFSVEACHNNSRQAKNYNNKTSVDGEGLTFLKNGLEGSYAEIKLSQLAEQNSQNSEVLDFAKMMITDHSDIVNDMEQLAKKENVITSDSLTLAHQQMIDQLKNKTGADFDKTYMQTMVTDHEKAVKLYESATTDKNHNIQDFALKILPKIKEHLTQANDLCTDLK
ncbi:DUF4142 domain-containing protein [Mucilaginibacter segetis]|uniref:DUF4142 domain-containing protein n=1 Tax=Mucilaginibacter segetis TaxID=2793071 RepID=A0A934PX22_9SPHI|nr:DUF4142 domain-containing protein [Mucilaginibacter segetis]MBK0381046.1 DUF4142 domain-containing protein [Mucilaginibacter segetis]